MKEKKIKETANESKKIDVLAYMKAISHNIKVIERLHKKLSDLQEANAKMRIELVDHLNNGGEL